VVEFGHQRRWATREEAQRDLFGYVEGYYNRSRNALNPRLPHPEQAEKQMAS
jgi:hypothetical protein